MITPIAILGALAIGAETAQSDPVWAVNVGGPAYTSKAGIAYQTESHVSGGRVVRIERVLGAQDPVLYETTRSGDIRVAKPLDNGVYQVTFHFAEPAGVEVGERVFDVIAQGKRILTELDVRLFRDGKVDSALTVTVPDIEVTQGELNIEFEASSGEPILSALEVRRKKPQGEGWQLVWSDEFDQDGAPDASLWNYEEWGPKVVNDEDQAYTTRRRNARIEDGRLIIEAHREAFGEAAYTSARLHSKGKGDFLYGRFEVRARLPRGQGTWPAIWMLPSDPFRYATTCTNDADWQGSDSCDAWPNSGEIDIMEHVGYQMNHVHATVHTKAYYWLTWQQRKGRIVLDDVVDTFHTYVIEWSPERIDAFVDDVHYFSYVNEGDGWQSWPFDQPFHLILNIAIGGAWGRAGGPVDDSIFPQRMEIDYVRVFQRNNR